MKTFAVVIAGAALAAGVIAPATARSTIAERGEARLAAMLEGRTAGEPVRCISATRSNRLQVIDSVGVVYDAGETIYVARPHSPKALDWNDALVIERFGSQLCTSDMTRTFDRSSPHFQGVVFFDHFVPYRKG